MRMLIVFLALSMALTAAGQDTALDKAVVAYNASDFATAADLFQKATAADASNGAAWEGLGMASLKSGHFAEANAAFKEAVNLKWRPYLNRLNLARVAAKAGETGKALQTLRDLAATGRAAQLRPYLQVDEFSSLRNMPEFQKISEDFVACHTPEFRQFDFLLGDWTVQNPSGQLVGTNQWTLEQDGCLLVEHWKSARGFETGTSFNYYDINDSKWHQLYISNSGNARAYPPMAGELKDSRMVMLTEMDNGTQFRWTWYVVGPGKVRQMAEKTTNGGKTWAITWDSIYIKDKKE